MATVLTPAEIKQKITDWITTNGQGDITGAHLNTILAAIMDYVGVGYAYMGKAPASAPSPDVPVFYIAEPGSYSNYADSAIVVPDGSLCVFRYDGSEWNTQTLSITTPVSILNINAFKGEPTTPYAILAARSYVPISKRKPGLIITYLSADGWHTETFIGDDISDWGDRLYWQSMDATLDNGGIKIDALKNATGYIGLDGDIVTNTSFNNSDFISVEKGDIIIYTGVVPNRIHGSAIAGYDIRQNYISSLLQTSDNAVEYIMHRSVAIVDDSIKYVRVCAGNSTRSDYQYPNVVIIKNAHFLNAVTDALSSFYSDINLLKENDEQLDNSLGLKQSLTFDLLADSGGRIMWGQLPNYPCKVFVGGLTYIDNNYGDSGGPTLQIRASRGGDVIRTVTITPGRYADYIFELTQADLDSGATYFRLASIHYESATDLNVYCYLPNLLKGKKLAVIGDSISTISGNNNPYWKVQSVDVGREISAYVTWWDVWSNDAGTTPTNKTIGGVTLTSAMIGTLQTFTPVVADVGKSIGVPANYNSSSTKVWSEKLCELTGMKLIANASWSGSRICSGQTGSYVLSEAWNDYTIGCCKTRDNDGNEVLPDVIIIYRGTNDFSHDPLSRINDISLMSGVPDTDLINSVYEYKAGYYKTIAKLRAAYPKAYIICCTLNVFKRMTHDVFPTRNSYYTLPEMNDAIREIANTMGCGLIEFDKDGITFENCYSEGYITDSSTIPTHPNSKGHAVMAQKAMSDLKYVLQ